MGTRVYVAGGACGAQWISVIDTATNTVGAGGAPQISVIDTATNTVIDSIPLTGWGCGLSISPDGSLIYVALPDNNSVSVIDTMTNTVIGTIWSGITQELLVIS